MKTRSFWGLQPHQPSKYEFHLRMQSHVALPIYDHKAWSQTEGHSLKYIFRNDLLTGCTTKAGACMTMFDCICKARQVCGYLPEPHHTWCMASSLSAICPCTCKGNGWAGWTKQVGEKKHPKVNINQLQYSGRSYKWLCRNDWAGILGYNHFSFVLDLDRLSR